MSAIKYFYKMPPGEFYFDIDLEIVWETAVSALPDLQKRLNAF